MIKQLPRIPLILIAIAATGIAISFYLTSVHYTKVPLVCSSHGLINCERVLTSSYSSVLAIPISVGGLLWFSAVGALALMSLVRKPEPCLLQPLQVLWSFLGLLVVVYLVGVEMLGVDAICVWCTVLHVLILATLILSIVRIPRIAEEKQWVEATREATPADQQPDASRRPSIPLPPFSQSWEKGGGEPIDSAGVLPPALTVHPFANKANSKGFVPTDAILSLDIHLNRKVAQCRADGR